MSYEKSYKMSFPYGGLNLCEFLITTNAYLSSNYWNGTRLLLIKENLLLARMISSAKRMFSEIIPRLQFLSERELHLFHSSTEQDQHHLLWLPTYRTHATIADFSTPMVHDW